MSIENSILIYGGGEIASAIAIKLFQSGFKPIMYVNENEIFLRHNLCLGDAVFQNQKTVGDVTATTISEDLLNIDNNNSYMEKIDTAVHYIIKDRKIPVLHQISFEELIEVTETKIIINTLTETPSQVNLNQSQTECSSVA